MAALFASCTKARTITPFFFSSGTTNPANLPVAPIISTFIFYFFSLILPVRPSPLTGLRLDSQYNLLLQAYTRWKDLVYSERHSFQSVCPDPDLLNKNERKRLY